MFGLIERNGSMYDNSGILDDDDDDVNERSVADMLAELQRHIHASESRLSTWKDLRTVAETDAVEARQVVYYRPIYNTGTINPLMHKVAKMVTQNHGVWLPPLPPLHLQGGPLSHSAKAT